MARPIRVEYANAVYHVTARSNERKVIYRDDADRQRFLETLERPEGPRRGDVKYQVLNPFRFLFNALGIQQAGRHGRCDS